MCREGSEPIYSRQSSITLRGFSPLGINPPTPLWMEALERDSQPSFRWTEVGAAEVGPRESFLNIGSRLESLRTDRPGRLSRTHLRLSDSARLIEDPNPLGSALAEGVEVQGRPRG